jgi:hypothetical protein
MMPPTKAQIDIERADRAAADHDAGGSAVVGYGVEDLARVLQPGVDDLERRHDVFGGAQHVGQADAGTFERLAHDEGELDLDPRQAEVLMPDARAIGDHHIVEQEAEVRLVDLRGALHCLRGEANLVADQLGAGGDLAVGDYGRDRVGVVDGDVGPGFRELNGLLARLLGGDEDVGGLVAVGFGQHAVWLPRIFEGPSLAHDAAPRCRAKNQITGRWRATAW